MAKQIGKIEDDTPIMPAVVADGVVRQANDMVGGALSDEEERGFADALHDEAQRIYRHNERFRKKLRGRGRSGLDHLYAFMQHWFAAGLKKARPDLFKQLPPGYGWSQVY
jgi:hypothetical protein